MSLTFPTAFRYPACGAMRSGIGDRANPDQVSAVTQARITLRASRCHRIPNDHEHSGASYADSAEHGGWHGWPVLSTPPIEEPARGEHLEGEGIDELFVLIALVHVRAADLVPSSASSSATVKPAARSTTANATSSSRPVPYSRPERTRTKALDVAVGDQADGEPEERFVDVVAPCEELRLAQVLWSVTAKDYETTDSALITKRVPSSRAPCAGTPTSTCRAAEASALRSRPTAGAFLVRQRAAVASVAADQGR